MNAYSFNLETLQGIERCIERRTKWLATREVGGLKPNGITMMDFAWHQGYLASLRDVLDSMKQPGNPSAIGKI